MKLFVMRHGEASYDAQTDDLRSLTEIGKRETRALLESHKEQLSQVQSVWCSPLTRARQTADLVVDYCGLSCSQILQRKELRPEANLKALIQVLQREMRADSVVLMVSHQPLIGELVSLLTSGDSYQAYPFMTSEIVLLEGDLPIEGLCKLSAALQP